MKPRAQPSWMTTPTPEHEIKSHVRRLMYLRTPEKVHGFLRYEYGNRPLPSVEQIARIMATTNPDGSRRRAHR